MPQQFICIASALHTFYQKQHTHLVSVENTKLIIGIKICIYDIKLNIIKLKFFENIFEYLSYCILAKLFHFIL